MNLSAAARRIVLIAAASGVAVTVFTRPVQWGVGAAGVMGFWMVTLALIVLPGTALCRAIGMPRADGWLLAGQGTTVGLAVHGLAMLAGRASGTHWIGWAIPLTLTLGWLVRRRPDGSRTRLAGMTLGAALTLLSVMLAGVALQPLYATKVVGQPVPADLLFHAGNAAELLHRWPLQDPRLAGLPLHYHLLSYALPVEASGCWNSPVADQLLAVVPLFWVALLALQLANIGRVFFDSAWAGILGAAIVLFHADPGSLLGLGPFAFGSYLATGIYGSPTTIVGLILLAGLAIAIAEFLDGGGAAALTAIAILSCASSAAKPTVLPAVAGGMLLACAWAAARGRRGEARLWLAPLAIVVLAGLPLSLWQAGGEASYRSLVGWRLAAAFWDTRLSATLDGGIGLLPLWLVGYFGIGGAGSAVFLALGDWSRRRPVQWLIGVVVVGIAAVMIIDVRDFSQLFVLYNGQVLLGPMAGAGLIAAARRRRDRAVWLALLLPFAVPCVDILQRSLRAASRADTAAAAHEVTPLAKDYQLGLAWLRSNASGRGVVFADNPSLLLSAFGEVRLFYENGLFSARRALTRSAAEDGDLWPERTRVQRRLLREPSDTAVTDAVQAAGSARPVLIVVDDVASRIDAGLVRAQPAQLPRQRLFPEPRFRSLFANSAMHVYELRTEAGAPAAH